MVLGLAIPAFGEVPVIGIVMANNDQLKLDGAAAASNATVFDGAVVQSGGYSRIYLTNGSRIDFSAGSSGRVYAHSMSLTSGMSEIQSSAGYELYVNSLKIQPAAANSIARVRIENDKRVVVMALNAPVSVLNSQGILVAKVPASGSLAFVPQATAAARPSGQTSSPLSFDQKGCVLQKGTAAVLVDDSGNNSWELHAPEGAKGKFNPKIIGDYARVVGIVDGSSTPTPGSGAQKVVVYGSIRKTKGTNCGDLAAKVGASATVAAGLTVGVAGGAAAGAAAGAAISAGVGVGVSVVSTAVVVAAGVSVAAAASLAGAASAGAFTPSSP